MRAPGAIGDQPAEPVGDELEDDREGAGLLQDPGVVHDLPRLCCAPPLHAEAAERAGALGRQAEVAHDRDARPRDALQAIGHLGATFELDGIAAGLGHEPAGVADRGLDARLVAHVGHVADDPRVGRPAPDRRGVPDHVIHRDRQGAVEAEHRHAQAVTHEDHVHARLVLHDRRRVVVAGQPGDGCPGGHLGVQGREGDLLAIAHAGAPIGLGRPDADPDLMLPARAARCPQAHVARRMSVVRRRVIGS